MTFFANVEPSKCKRCGHDEGWHPFGSCTYINNCKCTKFEAPSEDEACSNSSGDGNGLNPRNSFSDEPPEEKCSSKVVSPPSGGNSSEYQEKYYKKRMEENQDYNKERHDKRKDTEGYKKAHKKAKERYEEKFPEKKKAGIKAQKIKLEGLCQRCQIRSAEHRHHEDYSKPLEVKLLCSKCHREVHKDTQSLSDKRYLANIEKGRRYEPMYPEKDVKDAVLKFDKFLNQKRRFTREELRRKLKELLGEKLV